ncbi:MAG: DUF805 domain-containing protein [Tissierellales bacterium]|nr:DUF805 domain-containing protein [Tissierellales bacterium]
MAVIKCSNCEQVIGNLEKSYSFQNRHVCFKCKNILEEQANLLSESGLKNQEVDTKENLTVSEEINSGNTYATMPTKNIRHYSGVGRLFYFIVIFGSILVLGMLSPVSDEYDQVGLPIGIFVIHIVITALRLQNIGRSPALSLLLFVPILNLVVTVPCFFAPEGYADTKQLDTVGKVIISLILALFLIFCLIIGYALIFK